MNPAIIHPPLLLLAERRRLLSGATAWTFEGPAHVRVVVEQDPGGALTASLGGEVYTEDDSVPLASYAMIQVRTMSPPDRAGEFRLAVIGDQNLGDYQLVKRALDTLLAGRRRQGDVIRIQSAGLGGADNLGVRYATERGDRIDRHAVDWTAYGKQADLLCDRIMLGGADGLVAFWGRCRRTRGLIGVGQALGLPVRVVRV